ncbi:hypothetical protein GCM10010522_49880 [Kribbella solani]
MRARDRRAGEWEAWVGVVERDEWVRVKGRTVAAGAGRVRATHVRVVERDEWMRVQGRAVAAGGWVRGTRVGFGGGGRGDLVGAS